MDKPVQARYPIHDLLQKRWSPRAFSARPVESDKLRSLFEAARWAPSSFNEQPWSFIVATRDIGAKAAEFLADRQFRGQTAFEFVGPRPVTMQEATSVLGKAIGKPDMKYVQFDYEVANTAMLGAGMRPDWVGLVMEMNRGFNDGLIRTTQPMTQDHLGRTSIEHFAEEFAAAFRAATRK